MQVIPQRIPEVLVIEPQVFGDERGFFIETFHASRYAASGMAGPFLQDNLSRSRFGILRGLHLQHPHGQGKLVSVVEGSAPTSTIQSASSALPLRTRNLASLGL